MNFLLFSSNMFISSRWCVSKFSKYVGIYEKLMHLHFSQFRVCPTIFKEDMPKEFCNEMGLIIDESVYRSEENRPSKGKRKRVTGETREMRNNELISGDTVL